MHQARDTFIIKLKVLELGICVCITIKNGTENMILILPGHITEVTHDLTYLKAGMILFKSFLHKHRYVKYVSLSPVKNAGTSCDMWYMQQLSSRRRREYFIAKLAFSVVIVSSIYHIFSEVNTEHSFQCYLFLQGVILEGSRKNIVFLYP